MIEKLESLSSITFKEDFLVLSYGVDVVNLVHLANWEIFALNIFSMNTQNKIKPMLIHCSVYSFLSYMVIQIHLITFTLIHFAVFIYLFFT